MEICELKREEFGAALALAWDVFRQFEAPDYSQQGIDGFYNAIHDEKYIDQLRIYAASDKGELAGIIATRNGGGHIALFFVKENYQHRGVGRALFLHCALNSPAGEMTVNSSPYAVKIYHCLGFTDTAPELIQDGIRYTPMRCVIKNPDCPCKRAKCSRHGSCVVCWEHHRTKKNCSPACER